MTQSNFDQGPEFAPSDGDRRTAERRGKRFAEIVHRSPKYIQHSAHSLQFFGGLELLNAAASSHHRSDALSALNVAAYASLGTVALLLGAVATAQGLGSDVNLSATYNQHYEHRNPC
jgi:hypothetical protein